MDRRDKKKILDNLFYNIGKQQFDFLVCGLKKRDGEIISTKWKKFSDAVFPIDFDGTSSDYKEQNYFDNINQRQIFPNELVLDIEDPKKLNPIIKKLEIIGLIFQTYKTGSRGYHIHIIFKENIEEREKMFYIKKFGVDEMKAYTKTLIALENVPHWKTGNLKELI